MMLLMTRHIQGFRGGGGLALGTLLSVDYSHILFFLLEFNQTNDFFNAKLYKQCYKYYDKSLTFSK